MTDAKYFYLLVKAFTFFWAEMEITKPQSGSPKGQKVSECQQFSCEAIFSTNYNIGSHQTKESP